LSATAAAVVAVVGIIGLFNLVLCLGIIRRLREHTAILDSRFGAGSGTTPMHAAGATVGDFDAVTVDGAAISRSMLTGTTLVGLFSPGCAPCQERLPQFVEQAGRHRGAVLAVVAGPAEDATAYIEALRPVARVVREDDHGPVATALGVEGFPSFALLDAGGVVLASGAQVGALAAAVPA
jgi:thiol-disulfide isomerase/thioredoxin